MASKAFPKVNPRKPQQRTPQMIKENLFAVDAVIGERVTEEGQTQYLVDWTGHGSDGTTWEPPENIPDSLITDYYNRDQHLDDMDVDEPEDAREDSPVQSKPAVEVIDLTMDDDDTDDDADLEEEVQIEVGYESDHITDNEEFNAIYVTSLEASRIVGELTGLKEYEVE